MKLDLKSSLIVVLFIGFAIFFAKWWLESDSHRRENIQLKKEIKEIQSQRDSLVEARKKIDFTVDSLQNEIKKTFERISQLDAQIKSNKVELQNAKNRLYLLQSALIASRKKIEELKTKPIKRTGDSLLNSIKEKTK